MAWNGFCHFFLQFLGWKAEFIEKKVFFLLSGQRVYPPYTLSGPTTKKTLFFMCVFPKKVDFFFTSSFLFVPSALDFS